jgi:hypothetical protein
MSAAKLAALACVVLVLAAVVVHAQAVSGSITGLVADPSGAYIPNANVLLNEVVKGVSFTTTTNELGYYTKALIPPGNYTISVEAPGFKAAIRQNVLLSVDSTVRADFTLAVGAVFEQVVVSDAPPVLKSERADVSTVLDNRLINELPTLNRNFAALQLLIPGTMKDTGQTGIAENPQGSVSMSSNGQPNGARNMQLDGVDNNETVLGGNVVIPTMESIREFKVTTTGYDAEFGRAGGAVTQVETKSGEKGFHGSLFEFLRNDKSNARNSFTEPTGPPPFKWNQFGGSLGGPIKRGKSFFFGDYQGARQRLGNTTSVTVPTDAMRLGDFSNVRNAAGNLVPIYDPLSGNADGSGRKPFEGNIIPAERISPIARNLLNLLPSPTFPNLTENNYIATGSVKFDTNQYSARLDHYFSESSRFFGRYIYFGSDVYAPPVFGPQGGGVAIVSGVGGYAKGRNQNLSLNVNHVITPSLLVDGRYGYSRYRVNVLQPDYGTNLAQQVGIPNINFGGIDTSGLSRINVNGIGSFSMGGGAACNCPLDEVMNYQQWASNVSWVKGSHTTKYGADIRRFWNYRRSDGGRRGVFGFDPGVTGLPGISNSGLGLAGMLLGTVSSYSRVWSMGRNDEFETHVFFYAQDQWKITPKLTLNYGLRYEIYTPPAARPGMGANLDLNSGDALISGLGGISNSANIMTDPNNIAPRIGMTYLASRKTVLRLGLGRSYFPNVYAITISGQTWPFWANQSVSAPTSYSTIFNISQGAPPFAFPEIPSSGRIRLPDGISTLAIPFDRQTAYIDSWNFAVQRELAKDVSVEAAYVGNVGHHLYYNNNVNQAYPGPGPLNPRRVYWNKFGWSQRIQNRANAGSSNFHSFQGKIERRMSADISFIASYTFSKTIDFGTYDAVSDGNNFRIDRGPADRDRMHIFTLGHVYELPFGPGKPFASKVTGAVRQIIEGWKFAGITVLESGLPFSPQWSSTAPVNTDFQRLRPDLVGDPTLTNPTRDLWFNPAAFAVPTGYRMGTAGRNIMRGPCFVNGDWALYKEFRIGEQMRLQFRSEAYNAFNNTHLRNPVNTVDTPTAGKITGTIDAMRQLQFGLRLSW